MNKRGVRVLAPVQAGAGVIHITDDKGKGKSYLLRVHNTSNLSLKTLANDGQGEGYRVDLANGTCTCKGFVQWKHCKHVGALLALKGKGKL